MGLLLCGHQQQQQPVVLPLMCCQPCARAREIHWGVQISCPRGALPRQILVVEADEGETGATWLQHGGSTAPAECLEGAGLGQEVSPSIMSGVVVEHQKSDRYSDIKTKTINKIKYSMI